MNTKHALKKSLWVGVVCIVISAVIFLVAIGIEQELNTPPMTLSPWFARLIALALIIGAFLVFFYSLVTIPRTYEEQTRRKSTPYYYVRHPMYSVFIFMVYPAIGFLVMSKAAIISTIFVYFTFHLFVWFEERIILNIYKEEYLNYVNQTPRFIPKFKRQKLHFERGRHSM